ncbi:urease accessory protein UreE [Granulicoccus sp. GXG6511]|uniref:urease accessory protein UreE n=1 Tax=Granulicoccus sp. GXG6511 TaxID=3381351 RepID=UPI003D7D585F
MLITNITGNVNETPLPDGVHVETITVPSAQLVKRIQRMRTDHGTEVGLRLPTGSADLRDGDILALDDHNAIVVRVEATDVLVIRARSILEMAVVAHTLGNRHLQAQFFGADSEYDAEVMVVQYDHTVEQYLQGVGVPFERQDRIMPVPFRHSEHTH